MKWIQGSSHNIEQARRTPEVQISTKALIIMDYHKRKRPLTVQNQDSKTGQQEISNDSFEMGLTQI